MNRPVTVQVLNHAKKQQVLVLCARTTEVLYESVYEDNAIDKINRMGWYITKRTEN